MKFKAGDKIVCINSDCSLSSNLHKGKTYIITSRKDITSNGHTNYFYYINISDFLFFREDRFRLLTKTKKGYPFIISI